MSRSKSKEPSPNGGKDSSEQEEKTPSSKKTLKALKLKRKIYTFSLHFARARDIELSEHAEKLLRLSADAWVDELQLVPSSPYHEAATTDGVIGDILKRTFDDPHVEKDMETSGFVSYPSLFVALSTAGVEVLRPLFEKGF